MAFVFYRHPRRPNEVSATIAGSELAIQEAVERLEHEGNVVTAIIPPPTNLILQGKNPSKPVLLFRRSEGINSPRIKVKTAMPQRITSDRTMFVLCITRQAETHEYVTYSSTHEARSRFDAAVIRVPDDFDGVAVFEVGDTDDPKKAVKTVKAGKAKLLERDLRSGLLEDAREVLDELLASPGKAK